MKKTILGAIFMAAVMGLAGSAFAGDGAAVYKSKCLACHGPEGKGTGMGPAFAGSDFIRSSSDEAIADVIVKGRNGAEKKYKKIVLGMPAQKLNDDELSSVVAYLKSLATK